jgi:hypothetical protein
MVRGDKGGEVGGVYEEEREVEEREAERGL